MKTARLVRELEQRPYAPGRGWRNSAKLWEMAMECALYVVTEASAIYGRPEEVIFWASDATGSHGHMRLGSVRGTLDHETALVVAGYLPSNSEPCLCGQFSPAQDSHGVRCTLCRGLGVEPSDEQAHVETREQVMALLMGVGL